jgi:hypothetical protein
VVVAEGLVASLGAQTYVHDLMSVPGAATQVQVIHAAPNAPALAIYITAPGAALSSSTPIGTASFQGSVGPTQIPAGSVEIRVTPAGASTPVLFDSGPVTLDGGSDLVVSALQNEGPGAATIILSLLDAGGSSFRLFDMNTPAELRVVQDSPDAPAFSVITNGNTAAPLVPSLAYAAFTAYLPLTPANLPVAITPAGNTADILVQQSLNLQAGTNYTLYAAGDLAKLGLLVTRDNDRRYATQAKLRVIHGSPSAGLTDVYLTPTGTSIASVNPTYASIPFQGDTGFVSFTAGSYALTVTAAGSKTPVIGPVTVQLANSGIYTAVARDATGGGTPLGLILLDDFATP